MKQIFRQYLKRNENSIGMFGAILSVIMFVSLIEICIANFRGESNIIIQPASTAINCLCWVLYSYSKGDKFIMIPNMLGCGLGIITAIFAIV